MVFCKKCGKVLNEGSTRCEYCGHDQIEFQQQGTEVVPPVSYSGYTPVSPSLSNTKKVVLTAVTCLISGVGYIIGLIVGVVYMGNDNPDTKSFGKALMILSVILLGLTVVCCILYFVVFSAVFASVFQELSYMGYGY